MFKTEFEALGSHIFLELLHDDASIIASQIKSEANRIEQKYSRFKADSVLSKLNENCQVWQSVDSETFQLLVAAVDLQTLTNGTFDITVKKILDHWGYDQHYSLTPQAGLVDFDDQIVQVDRESQRVKLLKPIDFGGLGKGYFVDQAKKICDENNVTRCLINAGGDMYGRDGADGFEVFFENPNNLEQVIGKTNIEQLFIASSSPARRKWRDYHHLVDPRICKPANDCQAVYVQSKTSGLIADAYSTALFVMGFKDAKAYLMQSECAVEAMLISSDFEIFQSAGFRGKLFYNQ